MVRFNTSLSGGIRWQHAVPALVVATVLLVGGAVLVSSGAPHRGTALLVRVMRGPASYTQLRQPQPYTGDPPDCKPAKLDLHELRKYGCRLDTNVCFDQNKILNFNSSKLNPLKYPYYDFGWLPSLTPGWTYKVPAASDEAPGGSQVVPLARRNSSLDRPDLHDPVFSQCYTPLLWISPWHQTYGEWFPNTVTPLYWMQEELKLFDREIMLVPIIDGFRKEKFLEGTLRPFTNKMIEPFNEVASRARAIDPTWPRCFSRTISCRFHNMYNKRPAANFVEFRPDGTNFTTFDRDERWTWFRPALAGKYLVDYYRGTGELPPLVEHPGVLNILVVNRTGLVRRFLELDAFMDACSAWAPPTNSGYHRTACRTHTFGKDYLEDVRQMLDVDIFVTHHGGECPNGWFMPFGSSIVEVRMKDFDGIWPDTFVRSHYRLEDRQFYWQARVVKDGTWKPAIWEETDDAEFHYVNRDRHTVVRWDDFRPIFEKILSIGRDRDKYRALPYAQVKWDI